MRRSLLILPVVLAPLGLGAAGLKMDVPGAELAKEKCLLCHDADNIVRLRQNRGGWEDTVDLMIRRGAPITPAERAVILDYLSAHYGEK